MGATLHRIKEEINKRIPFEKADYTKSSLSKAFVMRRAKEQTFQHPKSSEQSWNASWWCWGQQCEPCSFSAPQFSLQSSVYGVRTVHAGRCSVGELMKSSLRIQMSWGTLLPHIWLWSRSGWCGAGGVQLKHSASQEADRGLAQEGPCPYCSGLDVQGPWNFGFQ